MIVQNLTRAGRAEISFSVLRNELPRALALTQEAVRAVDPGVRVVADPDIAKLYVLGVGIANAYRGGSGHVRRAGKTRH